MKILTINAGSSSMKFMVYQLPEQIELISGNMERVGLDNSFYNVKVNGEKYLSDAILNNHGDAIEYLKQELVKHNIVESLDEITGVGHRVVHGGDKFSSSVVIDDEVLKTIEDLSALAPLHNPPAVLGIKAAKKYFGNATHVAVFDTAFHQTIKKDRFMYALPYEMYDKYSIRKYGFHGTSHKYITGAMSERLKKENVNLIVAHIGSGASMSCIKNSACIDTTMGFTPTCGLVMGTRCGDIDPAIVTFLINQGYTTKEVDNMMNKESGLLGVSGIGSDSRDVEAAMHEGNERAIIAKELQVNSVVDSIARYYFELEGNVDAICFTAGLGENSMYTRELVLSKLAFLGIHLDKEVNDGIASYLNNPEGIITTADSKVPVYVLPTNEELMIALDTYEFIK